MAILLYYKNGDKKKKNNRKAREIHLGFVFGSIQTCRILSFPSFRVGSKAAEHQKCPRPFRWHSIASLHKKGDWPCLQQASWYSGNLGSIYLCCTEHLLHLQVGALTMPLFPSHLMIHLFLPYCLEHSVLSSQKQGLSLLQSLRA